MFERLHAKTLLAVVRENSERVLLKGSPVPAQCVVLKEIQVHVWAQRQTTVEPAPRPLGAARLQNLAEMVRPKFVDICRKLVLKKVLAQRLDLRPCETPVGQELAEPALLPTGRLWQWRPRTGLVVVHQWVGPAQAVHLQGYGVVGVRVPQLVAQRNYRPQFESERRL